jgi:hypothetical protein
LLRNMAFCKKTAFLSKMAKNGMRLYFSVLKF